MNNTENTAPPEPEPDKTRLTSHAHAGFDLHITGGITIKMVVIFSILSIIIIVQRLL